MNRHLARSLVLQTLFEYDFNKRDRNNVSSFLDYNIKNFAPGLEGKTFVNSLLDGVFKKIKKLDSIIKKAAPEWPLEQIAMIDRNVLRIGLYELLFSDNKEVPPKVAINEAIELAKTFGGEKSGKFVNGVLGTVYKEIGEPGKDDALRNKNENQYKEKFSKEILGSAVIYKKGDDKIRIILVHDVFGYWTLPKGRAEGDESVKDSIVRAAKEKLGIDIAPEEELGANEYIASDPVKGRVKKSVTYFLADTNNEKLGLENVGGLDEVQWFTPNNVRELKIYEDVMPIISKAIKILTKN